MTGLPNNRFGIDNVNRNGIESLVVCVSNHEKVNNYQMEILKFNENLNFLKFECEKNA
jgi:hypothetical protein